MTSPESIPAPVETSLADAEREKLAIEREKLVVEREKLLVERYKARWSAIGVAVPLFAVAATVALGIWSQYQKSRDDFALKAAEILLQGDSPDSTKNKAITLQSLFPQQLPSDFAKSFDPAQFGADTIPSQKELLQLMAAKPENAMQILALWRAMFPEDDWIEPFAKNLASNPSFQRTASGRR